MISSPESLQTRTINSDLDVDEDVHICYPLHRLCAVPGYDPSGTKFSLAWLAASGIAGTCCPNLSTQSKRSLLPG